MLLYGPTTGWFGLSSLNSPATPSWVLPPVNPENRSKFGAFIIQGFFLALSQIFRSEAIFVETLLAARV